MVWFKNDIYKQRHNTKRVDNNLNIMKLFLKDTRFSHCLFSNNPLPPIQFSEEIEWDRSNNFKDSDYIIFTDDQIYNTRNNNQKDIAWLVEPYELQPRNYLYLQNNYNNFFKILTHDSDLLKLPNSYKIPYGGCWIKKQDFKIYDKSKNLSIVCSNKTYLSGHKLRHKVIKSIGNIIDVYGNGYNSISYKLESLQNYKYQIVIENVKKDFWFTEKTANCLATGKPFVLVSGEGSLARLRDMGFQTFDSVIDESYDLAKHPYDRIKRLISSLQVLYNSSSRQQQMDSLYQLASKNCKLYNEYIQTVKKS
jgi:hypothetical protein